MFTSDCEKKATVAYSKSHAILLNYGYFRSFQVFLAHFRVRNLILGELILRIAVVDDKITKQAKFNVGMVRSVRVTVCRLVWSTTSFDGEFRA